MKKTICIEGSDREVNLLVSEFKYMTYKFPKIKLSYVKKWR